VGLANQLTILRIFLIPVFIIFIGYNKPLYALLVFVIAGITDALDGFVARKLNQITTIGKVLDPIADKFGKLTTFFQILSVVVVLLANITYIPFELIYTIIYIATILT